MRTFRSALFLALASGAVVLFASARQWVNLTYRETGLPTINLGISGRELDPLPAGLAILVVATILALLISRGFTHRLLALIVAAAGVVIAIASWRAGMQVENLATVADYLEESLGRSATGQTSQAAMLWWAVSFVSGLLIALSGLALIGNGHDRPRGSSSYERPASEVSQLSPWQALDQGVDPTSTSDR